MKPLPPVAVLFLLSPAGAIAVPLDYFWRASGPAARPTLYLNWVFTAISLAVCVFIALLILGAIFRRRTAEEQARPIIREGAGLMWVYAGTGISTAVLFAMTVYMLVTLEQVSKPEHPIGLTITVTGYDWWWKAVYDDPDPARRIVAANEIHIPVGMPVRVKLESADVIHAFWVPQLAGKTQMIPGLTNEQWIAADRPGVYRGQCTQFCGLQHAHMAMEVVAETPEDFHRWQEAQRRPVIATSGGAGQRVFMAQCAACHAIRGTDATGEHGPDLTHVASRRLLAAGMMANTPENLADWIRHAQEIKPGSRMPDFPLSDAELSAVVLYLEALR